MKTPNSRRNLDEAIKRVYGADYLAYRKQQQWPPSIVADDSWTGLYDAQAEGLDVMATAKDAVAWANELIVAIDNAH